MLKVCPTTSSRSSQSVAMRRRFITSAIGALAIACSLHGTVQAQAYPSRPVKLIIPVPVGGAWDALARIIGEGMSKNLGQPVIVESKVGGTGSVAMVYLLQQPVDGYTILLTANAAFSLTPLLRKMPHKPVDDFTFIGRAVFAPNVIAVSAASPAKTLQEFVALAKAKPGQLSYGTILGAPQHIDFEKFKHATGTDIVSVPYVGGAPIVNEMMGMHVQATLLNAAIFTEYIKAGKIRGLATTSAKRLSYLPDVPTLAEAGFPDLKLDEGVYYGFVGAAGMPKPIVERLYQAITAAVSNPDTAKKLGAIGFDVSLSDGNSFRAEMVRELAANEKSLKTLSIKLE